MRKLFTFMSVSLNGFFEGPNHDLSWTNVDEEFNRFAIDQLRRVDTILFGRRSYQDFEDYWPNAAKDPNTSSDNLEIANLINNMNKVVFSRTLPSVAEKENWRNVKLIRDVHADEIKRWKEQPGKDMFAVSNGLIVSLAKKGLIDEFQIMVDPIVLGKGTPLFEGITDQLSLRLTQTRTFKSGNVLLTYEPAR